MYLSRVEIDFHKRQSMSDLTHVEAFHNWVEQSFPVEFDLKQRSRKLWRIDLLQKKQYLLIVSASKPDLHALELYGVSGTAETKNYDPFLESLQENMKMRFRVILNPVVCLSQRQISGNKRGRVVPHVTFDQQMKFLLSRAEKLGFGLKEDEFTIIDRGYVLFKKAKKPIHLSKVAYQGLLTIHDVDLMRKTLTEGIGKKKAYGFGMMTVIPVAKFSD